MDDTKQHIGKSALNGYEIYLLLQELSLTGARIEQIHQQNYEECLLALYINGEKKYLIINVSKLSHLYLLKNYKIKQVKSLRFKELLNSRIKSGTIINITSFPHDRSVVFHVKRGNEYYYLIILLWGNAANIYLCDANWQIIDAFYRKKEGVAQNQLQRFFDMQQEEHSCREPLRFTNESDSLNEVIIRYYQKNHEELDLTLSKKDSKLLKQLKNYQKGLIQLKNLEVKEALWREEELAFYNQIFPSPELYKEAWAKHQQKAHKIYQQTKNKEERFTLIQSKIDKIEKQLEHIQENHLPASDKKASEESFLRFLYHGYTILVGRNAKENDNILRNHTRGLDYWFHVHHFRGGFVLLKYQKKNQPPTALLDAAKALAHYYSKARGQHDVEILFTQVKELKRTKILGQVEVKHSQVLYYKEDKNLLQELLNQYLVK